MKSSLKTLAGVCALALATATTAIADPINGVITFAGNAVLNNADVNASTGVDAFKNVFVTGATGDFTAMAPLPTLSFGASVQGNASDDWLYNSPTGYSGTFWSVGGFVFLLDYSAGSAGGGFASASGIGRVYHTSDMANTMSDGAWYFSTQSGSLGNGTFSFSASTTVPDGGTTALLLGVALIGLGVIARRKL